MHKIASILYKVLVFLKFNTTTITLCKTHIIFIQIYIDQMNESRNKGWWEYVDQYNAEHIAMFACFYTPLRIS